MFTFKSIPVKSKYVFFFLYCLLQEVQWKHGMIEQKKFYSIAYSEQNIHETQEHSEQKNNSKKPR